MRIIERFSGIITKRGFTAYWESGGGFTNSGYSTIICDSKGEPKKPIYVKKGGHLANAEHALIVIEPNDYIINANHLREDFNIKIYKVLDIEIKEYERLNAFGKPFKDESRIIIGEEVNSFSQGEWEKELPEFLNPAVQASMKKASCYHCRKPHYIKIE